MSQPPKLYNAPLFVRGDIDGFFGLALDNLIQLLVIVALLDGVLGFPPQLLFGRVLPAAAVSVLGGNLYYAWQARQLARNSGRSDVTSLPYGINTVSLFAFVFLVMLPVRLAVLADGGSSEQAADAAWKAGLVACLGSAMVEIGGASVAHWIRRHTPRAAMLSALAGIAVSFIALGFLFKTFASPLVGLVTLTVVLACYFGRIRFMGGIPGGLVAVTLGTALAWATGLVTTDPAAWTAARNSLSLSLPTPALVELGEALAGRQWLAHLSIIVPMGLVNVVGSLQNIESAEAAGDAYSTGPSLLANGLGSLAAAAFGSCFPTTIYIGHPGWKGMGAGIGYSILNGIFITAVCLSGAVALIALAVPVEAGMAIVLWIGIVIVAQAFEATPRRHGPAVAVGLLPGIAAWGAFMLKQGLRAGGAFTSTDPGTGARIEGAIAALDLAPRGVFALEQGFILTAMVLAATTAEIIDRNFLRAAAWLAVAAVLSWLGLIHAYMWTGGDSVVALGWGAGSRWALAYAASALLLCVLPYVSKWPDGEARSDG